jgi:VWFA-related protein
VNRGRMSKHPTPVRALVLLAVCLGCAFPAPRAAAQSAPGRPKLKDFGKSVERLKWDEKRRAAVEKRSDKGKELRRGGEGGDEEDVVRVETSLVVCDVLVLDPQGRAVSGLTREDFLVAEDGAPQEVGTFALGDNAEVPRTIVLVIDHSGSQFPYIRMSVEAAKTLVDRLSPRDLMAVVTDDVELLADFTADKEKLKKKLDSLAQRSAREEGFLASTFGMNRRFGRSAQFSALMATLKEAFKEGDVRPVVIFQTDGDELMYLRDPVVGPRVIPNLPPDVQKEAAEAARRMQKRVEENRREFSLRDVHAAAEKARATVYTVVPGYRLVGLTLEEQMRRRDAARARVESVWNVSPEAKKKADERLRRLPPEFIKVGIEDGVRVQQALTDVATLTGGWADFLEEPGQAAAIYGRIFSDVSRRYVIGYQPTNKVRDGGRRRVSIEVRGHPEYTVWGRKAYYAPGPDQ